MACFLVPTGEAIVASIIEKRVAHNEDEAQVAKLEVQGRVPWKTKMKWLTTMLWGGALLLALEHIWHGEIVFYPPFLTAMSTPSAAAEMFQEMATVGVGMAVLVTAIWAVMVFVVDHVPSLAARLQGNEA